MATNDEKRVEVYTIQPGNQCIEMDEYRQTGDSSSCTSYSEASSEPPTPPGAVSKWMPPIPKVPNCPPGLEYLTMVKGLIIEQRVDWLEVFTDWEVSNSYNIYNSSGQQVYYAFEEENCCGMCCCGASRGYVIHVVDNYKREVMRIVRPFKCCGGMYCGNETYVEAPPGRLIGEVTQDCGFCKHDFTISDKNGDLQIKGPNECGFGFVCNCCSDKVFKVKTADGERVGEIRKKWTGAAQEYFTDADTFSVHFPRDLSVGLKATLIAATFLIDFLCFENNNPTEQHY